MREHHMIILLICQITLCVGGAALLLLTGETIAPVVMMALAMPLTYVILTAEITEPDRWGSLREDQHV